MVFLALSICGSTLPNTVHAKTNVDIPPHESHIQEIFYFGVNLSHDPIIRLSLLALVGFSLIYKERLSVSASFNFLVYFSYTISNGGDFMAGIFLDVPTFWRSRLGLVDKKRRINQNTPFQ